ncbi:MAG: glycosyltransferase family 4 protein [Candidatus Altiarchaeota archaeon]|nr:glycosyltransferase family 4 protein [Candidatus Altiarchaeota archaeon]
MRILQTARWFFPHVGGASVRVYQTAKNLVDKGHEVHLLVHNPKSIEQCNLSQEVPNYEEYDGIHVYRMPYFAPKQVYWAATIPLMAKKAINIIKKEKIDVILSHNPPYLVGMSSWIASKFTGVPLTLNVHDVWGAPHYKKYEYMIGKSLERFCCNRAKRIITVSEGLSEVLANETGVDRDKVTAAPNGVDIERFRIEREETDKLKEKYDLSGKKVVFFVGILRTWAGIQFLIKAFPKVLEKQPESVLFIVGDGGDRKYLESLVDELEIRENTVFTGSVPYSDVPSFIDLADVCVAPFPSTKVTDSRKLMSPHKVLEYMAAEKAVIASRVGGMENYVEEGETGFLVEPEDISDLANKIIALLEDPNMRERFGRKGREHVAEKHAWTNYVGIVEKTLEDVLT